MLLNIISCGVIYVNIHKLSLYNMCVFVHVSVYECIRVCVCVRVVCLCCVYTMLSKITESMAPIITMLS